MKSIDARDNLKNESIAIIGMACLYPGAPNVREFWRNILGGVDSVTDPPPGAWDPGIYYDPDSLETDRIYCKRGGYIEDLATFDPLLFGVPPKDVGGEPDQWLALKLARDALIDAGYADAPDEIKRRTAVILGRGQYPDAGSVNAIQHSLIVSQTLDIIRSVRPDLGESDIEAFRQQLKSSLPRFGADIAPALTPNMTVGRIANRFNLMGPNYAIDAACASSLVAIKMASRELLNGDCDMALAGGSQVWTSMPILSVFGQMGALSRSERIRPFDKEADGTILGEGVGLVVLKRLSDAERDGDRIYAVVRGIGIASDGRSNGLMAPRVEGQVLAMQRAYEDAGIAPETVELIEAHGTGTPVGDAVEIRSMTEVFGERRGQVPNVAIGSVKSMIGHAMPAAGAAGIIKTALALHHKVLPPSLHCDEPNPKFELDKTPFYVNGTTRAWIDGHDHPRRAGVSAFGFGGINGHVVLEEYVPASESDADASRFRLQDHLPGWDSELCVFTGASREELVATVQGAAAQLQALASADEGAEVPSLLEVAASLAADARHEHGQRLAIVATSVEDLAAKAHKAADRLADPATKQIRDRSGIYYTTSPLGREGKLAFLFPGEGSQYVNMLSQLSLQFPEARTAFDEVDALHGHDAGGLAPSDYMNVAPASGAEHLEAAKQYLWTMDGAVTSVLAADEAMLRVLRYLGIEPDGVAGHSSGEYAALRTAGVFTVRGHDELAALAQALLESGAAFEREDAVGSAILLACGTDRAGADALLSAAGVDGFVAMDNCPNQVVIVADEASEAALLSAARERAIIAERLKFDRPYHTPWFASYSTRLRAAIDETKLSAPSVAIYSCATGEQIEPSTKSIADLIANQWSEAVEFRSMIERMYEDGYRVFVEVGPGNHLTSFVEDILRGKQFSASATNVEQRSDVTQLNYLAALLFSQGVNFEVEKLFARRYSGDDAASTAKKSPTEVTLVTTFTPMSLDASKLPSIRLGAGASPSAATANPEVSQATHSADSDMSHTATSSHRPVNDSLKEAALSPQTSPPNPNHAPPPGGSDDLARVAHRFLETMDHFLGVQERVMQAYLQSSGNGAEAPHAASNGWDAGASQTPAYASNGNGAVAHIEPPTIIEAAPPPPVTHATPAPEPPRPAPVASNGGAPAQAAPAPEPIAVAAAPAAAAVPLSVSLPEALRQIVSDRTGYPAEIIDVNADLEADLGIDSIKRVEILGTLRNQYEALRDVNLEQLTTCRTLQQIVDVVVGEAGGRPFDLPSADVTEDRSAEGISNTHPIFGELVEHEPGRRVVARFVVDPVQSPWLRDHTIGRDVSLLDASLTALPVMPLALSLELLAQAAGVLSPGQIVTRIESVRARRWIEFGDGAQTLEVRAQRNADAPARFECQILVLEKGAMTAAVEADLTLETEFAARPAAVLTKVATEPSRLATEDLYRETMCHGATWQGVSEITASSQKGMTAALSVPFGLSFSADSAPFASYLDPIALDAVGQLVGFWTAEYLPEGRIIFPVSVDLIEFYGPPSAPGERLLSSGCITALDDAHIRANLELVDSSGLKLRASGWQDRRFYFPELVEPMVRAAAVPELASEVDTRSLGIELDDATVCMRMELDFDDEAGLLSKVWASRIRTRNERERLGLSAVSIASLAREHVAKESICRLLRKTHGISLLPADVELHPGSEEQLNGIGSWVASLSGAPAVWLGSEGAATAAVASLSTDGADAKKTLSRRLASQTILDSPVHPA